MCRGSESTRMREPQLVHKFSIKLSWILCMSLSKTSLAVANCNSAATALNTYEYEYMCNVHPRHHPKRISPMLTFWFRNKKLNKNFCQNMNSTDFSTNIALCVRCFFLVYFSSRSTVNGDYRYMLATFHFVRDCLNKIFYCCCQI